ncbi:hypothetical protein KBC79_05610 [Candidatus Woesebacteria bacterium]|nr:hypothetical protein [Candidatus Woesebacteria bacterium]
MTETMGPTSQDDATVVAEPVAGTPVETDSDTLEVGLVDYTEVSYQDVPAQVADKVSAYLRDKMRGYLNGTETYSRSADGSTYLIKWGAGKQGAAVPDRPGVFTIDRISGHLLAPVHEGNVELYETPPQTDSKLASAITR